MERNTSVTGREYWPSRLTSELSILMNEAGYSAASRDQALAFCSRCVIPFLGPPIIGTAPRRWRDLMTDDLTVLKYGWTWDSPPRICISFEPTVADPGEGEPDPFNRTRPLWCVDALRSALPGADWTWFDSFADSFNDASARPESARDGTDVSGPSFFFIALEFGRDGDVIAKACLAPVRAEQTGTTRLGVLGDAIRRVEGDVQSLPAYALLEAYASSCTRTATPLDVVGVTVDCVAPARSKLNICLRSPATAFDAVCATLTLGGEHPLWTRTLLEELRELWYAVLNLGDDYPPRTPLPRYAHETGGVLYNFDVQASNMVPDTELYIPTRHYGTSDEDVLVGLAGFLRRRGRVAHAESFVKAAMNLCHHRDVGDVTGSQIYIACAVKRGSLSLTSYISPPPPPHNTG